MSAALRLSILATEARDTVDLYINTYKKMHDERCYEEAAQDELIRFSMALDFMMEVHNGCEPDAEKHMPEIICRALKTKACDVMKFAIRNHYPYYKKADYYHFDAKDATRVAASEGDYLRPRKTGINARIEANELLYAMKHGSKFGNGKTAEQMRAQWAEGIN
jgi:hypothetical protein